MATQQGEAGRGTPGWARRLAGYAWRYRKDVVLALGSSLAGMALMALVPLITKVIIDDVPSVRRAKAAQHEYPPLLAMVW